MIWSIMLTGDKSLLQMLSVAAANDNLKIKSENDDYLLQSNHFENCSSASEVNRIANELIKPLNGLLFLQFNKNTAIITGPVLKLSDTGGRDTHLITKPGKLVLTGYPVVITSKKKGESSNDSLGEEIIARVLKTKSSAKANKIFSIIRNSDWGFADMYKVYEILRSEEGKKLKSWDPNKIKLFTHTANNDKAIGEKARHAMSTEEPPTNPMDIEYARTMFKILISEFIDRLE